MPFLLRPQQTTMGIFATRGPRRVNPIGLSLVELIEVSGQTIHFAGVDLLDGTPVLDIKPYVSRFDRPAGQPGRPVTGNLGRVLIVTGLTGLTGLAVLQRAEPELELVDPVPQDLELRLVGELTFRGPPQPRGRLRSRRDQRKRHQALRAVRPVHQPGRDLAAPVPAAQRCARGSGLRGSFVERHPVGPVELSLELELNLPGVEPVLPVHPSASA
jgi:hypothetical protein